MLNKMLELRPELVARRLVLAVTDRAALAREPACTSMY